MPRSVYARTLQKAAELAGGPKKLAHHLRVPIAELEKWLNGQDKPPLGTFLKAVDLVLEETRNGASGSEPDDAPQPRDCAPSADGPALF